MTGNQGADGLEALTTQRQASETVAPEFGAQPRLSPRGKRAAQTASGWWRPLPVLILVTTVAALIAVWLKTPCRISGWVMPTQYTAGCYSDWAALFPGRGLSENPWAPLTDGATPGTTASFEYPVLIAVIAAVFAWLAHELTPLLDGILEVTPTQVFYDLNSAAVVGLWMLVVVLTALIARQTAPHRVWDALMVAVAPGIIFAGFINWDMWAVAAMMGALWAHSRNRPGLTGVLIGVGTAIKIFPLFLLGALFTLAVRHRKFADFFVTLGASAVSWSVVNLPFVVFNPAGWKVFYTYSAQRSPGWSSVWNTWNMVVPPELRISAGVMGVASVVLFALACAGIFVIGLTATRTPTAAELMLLLVVAFTLVNKVYSPQFVLWLIPLVALAWPRWPMFLVWQGVEVLHFWAIWGKLIATADVFETTHMIDDATYILAVAAHMLAIGWIGFRVAVNLYFPDPRDSAASFARLGS